MSEAKTVLVTGGGGFIGSWCVVKLLQRGYAVRTTVRNAARQDALRAVYEKMVDPGGRLRFYEADLNADAGWDAAADGCDYVLHLASPTDAAETRNAGKLIDPARNGTERVVRAATRGGAERIVVTSSVMATQQSGALKESLSDERVWTNLEDPYVTPYARSKTLAERHAWALITEAGSRTRLATVNPVLVLGPPLTKQYPGSVQVVERLLFGTLPGIPRFGFNFVDVRDVADLHILAMTAPAAGGERFIAAAHFAWMKDIAQILRDQLGDDAARVPRLNVPDQVIQLIGLVDRDVRSLVPTLGKKHDFSAAKAQTLLGWRPRTLEQMVVDCAKSLLALQRA